MKHESTNEHVAALTEREALKLALEALTKKEWEQADYTANASKAARILEQALAQPSVSVEQPSYVPEVRRSDMEPVELAGVKETIEEGGGIWRECTGCYETNEGYPQKGAYFSKVFKCYLGNGCDECGGIGAIWDTTDYEEMAKFMMEDTTPPTQQSCSQRQCNVKPLTHQDLAHLWMHTNDYYKFARAIEAAHGIKE
jgi:hypothetical protein